MSHGMRPTEPDDLIRRHSAQPDSEEPAPQIRLERYQQLEHQIRELPLYVNPYIELAEIYMQASRWSDARRVLEKAVERFPEEQKANFLLEESQLARAKQLLTQTEQEMFADASPIVKKKLDDSRLELNNLRARIFQSRLQRQPGQTQLLLPLADALQQLNRTEEAIETLRLATGHADIRAEASLQLGRMLEQIGNIPAALSAYRRAALFRIPQPEQSIKVKALEAAADLSENHQLYHSTRRYLLLLLDMFPDEAVYKKRLVALENKS
jgi:tetratricopeptide (TPR) repeat protein